MVHGRRKTQDVGIIQGGDDKMGVGKHATTAGNGVKKRCAVT